MPPGSPNPDPVADPKMPFSSPVFLDLACKLYTHIQTWRRSQNAAFTWAEIMQRDFVKPFESAYYSFFFIYLELKRQNTFIYYRSSLVAIPDSTPKWAKAFPVIRPKRRSPYLKRSPYFILTQDQNGAAHT